MNGRHWPTGLWIMDEGESLLDTLERLQSLSPVTRSLKAGQARQARIIHEQPCGDAVDGGAGPLRYVGTQPKPGAAFSHPGIAAPPEQQLYPQCALSH